MAYSYQGNQLPAEASLTADPQTYYSFATGKMVKGRPASGRHALAVTQSGPYVYGNEEEIKAFRAENPKLEPQGLAAAFVAMATPSPPIEAMVEEKKVAPAPVAPEGRVARFFKGLFGPAAPPAPPPVAPQPSFFASLYARLFGPAAPPAPPPPVALPAPVGPYRPDGKVTEVDDVPPEAIAHLGDFNFKGLNGRGKVIDIIDGDTMRILVYIPIGTLAEKGTPTGRGKNPPLKYPLATSIREGGFFAVFKVRLLGLDTAEKNTRPGQVAKELTIQRYHEINNIVYYVFEGFDKYGRLLATFYADSARTDNLNKFLVDREFDVDGTPSVVAQYYDGGTKSDYMKNLPTVPHKGAAKAEEIVLAPADVGEDIEEVDKAGKFVAPWPH